MTNHIFHSIVQFGKGCVRYKTKNFTPIPLNLEQDTGGVTIKLTVNHRKIGDFAW